MQAALATQLRCCCCCCARCAVYQQHAFSPFSVQYCYQQQHQQFCTSVQLHCSLLLQLLLMLRYCYGNAHSSSTATATNCSHHCYQQAAAVVLAAAAAATFTELSISIASSSEDCEELLVFVDDLCSVTGSAIAIHATDQYSYTIRQQSLVHACVPCSPLLEQCDLEALSALCEQHPSSLSAHCASGV
eukprot:13939-Heterococcus_DN1.PRE.4